MLTVGSLFSGIGGIDKGLEDTGRFQVQWQVEVDPWCRRVLAKHWPTVARYEDVRTFLDDAPAPVDLLAGGFPCQPVSVAGRGLAQADPRWLWPAFARAIRVLRPRLVLVENVPALRGRGFGDVLGDLAACGYDAEWDCIPACAVGANHQRDRLWLVAYARRPGRQQECRGPSGDESADARGAAQGDHLAHGNGQGDDAGGLPREVAHPPGHGRLEGRAPTAEHLRGAGGRGAEPGAVGHAHGAGSPERPERLVLVQQPTLERAGWWAVEPPVGRVATKLPGRVDRLRGLGNAVVPAVVTYLGEQIWDAVQAGRI